MSVFVFFFKYLQTIYFDKAVNARKIDAHLDFKYRGPIRMSRMIIGGEKAKFWVEK